MRLCDLGSRIIMNAVSLLTDDCVYLFLKGKKLLLAHNISFLEVGFCVLSNLFSKVTLLLFCRNIIIRSKNFLQIKSCPWHVWSKFKFFLVMIYFIIAMQIKVSIYEYVHFITQLSGPVYIVASYWRVNPMVL